MSTWRIIKVSISLLLEKLMEKTKKIRGVVRGEQDQNQKDR